MAFVSERMPEEEKEKLTFSVFTERDGSKPTLSRWVVDRERNAFLVLTELLGGGAVEAQESDRYVLSWNGRLVKFFADPYLGGDLPKGTMRWVVHDCTIPDELKGKSAEVRQLIREALDAKGYVYNRWHFQEVRVEFQS